VAVDEIPWLTGMLTGRTIFLSMVGHDGLVAAGRHDVA
jgi:hypothetical protein